MPAVSTAVRRSMTFSEVLGRLPRVLDENGATNGISSSVKRKEKDDIISIDFFGVTDPLNRLRSLLTLCI